MNTEIFAVGVDVIDTSAGQINRSDFETWLIKNQKLDWCYDTANYRGEHCQITGTLPIEEYYQTPYINVDIDEYVRLITAQQQFKLLPSLNKTNLKQLLL